MCCAVGGKLTEEFMCKILEEDWSNVWGEV